jgi:hypothetical protein
MGGGGDNKIEETEEQKELAKIAAETWNDYQMNMIPLENEYIKDVFNLRSPEMMEKARSFTSAAMLPETSRMMSEAESNLQERGFDPSSAGYVERSKALTNAMAASKGGGIARTNIEQQDRAYQGLENVMKMGSGQEGAALTGLTQMADLSGRYAAEKAQRGFNKATGRREFGGAVAGMGVGAALDSNTNNGLSGMSKWG